MTRLARTVVTRAGVSPSEFGEEFTGAEDCVLAAFETGIARVSSVIADAVEGEKRWVRRVRRGLSAGLRFLDAEPQWARLLVVEAPAMGTAALEMRDRALAQLGSALERGSRRLAVDAEGAVTLPAGLMAELVVGGLLSVIHTRLLHDDDAPLIELAPSLMSLIALPYLGPEAARAELRRSATMRARRSRQPAGDEPRPRTTYRTARVLLAIASAPNLSNREIASMAGLGDEGQMSRLLSRLQRQGLIENVGLGQAFGEANAWVLTRTGRRAAELSGVTLGPRAAAMPTPPRRPARRACQGDKA